MDGCRGVRGGQKQLLLEDYFWEDQTMFNNLTLHDNNGMEVVKSFAIKGKNPFSFIVNTLVVADMTDILLA